MKTYEDGMIEAAQIINKIYSLSDKERDILFGNKGFSALLASSQNILSYKDIMERKDELIHKYVEVGDVLRRDGVEYVVSYVSPNNKFDIITVNGPLKGSTMKDLDFDVFGAERTEDKLYKIDLRRYSWE